MARSDPVLLSWSNISEFWNPVSVARHTRWCDATWNFSCRSISRLSWSNELINAVIPVALLNWSPSNNLIMRSRNYCASQAIDNCVAPIIIFGDFRYPYYSSARMEKQTVLSHLKNNHFDTKGNDVFEDAAKSLNRRFST